MTLSTVNTKLEAYKLVHDPARLFSLLFSKYGEIEEDYNIFISNQLVFNKSSHLNILFKEKKILQDKEEYLRRLYHKKESLKRIPKLNEYYKNYHIFFCKATLTDFKFGKLLKNYEDNKAEIFYKNNYNDSLLNKNDNEKSEKGESSSLSSLDNITYNKIIFDKRNKEIIEKDLDSKNISITLTLDSLQLNKNDKSKDLNVFEENSQKEDSLIESIKNIVYYQENKKNKNNKKQNQNTNINTNNIIIKEITKKGNLNNKKDKIININNISKKSNENTKNKSNNKSEKIILEKQNNNNKENNSKLLNKLNIHNSLYSLTKKNKSKENKKNSNYHNNNMNEKNNLGNVFLSPQANKNYFTNITSRISEFNKYRPMNAKNSKRNKSYRINSNNNKKYNIIKQNQITKNNNKNYTFYPYNNQIFEHNISNLKNTSTYKIKNENLNNKNNSNNNIKSHPSQIVKYNQFLMMNNNKNKIKNHKNNKTFDLNVIGAQKNLKMLTKTKNFMLSLKKMAQSSNQSPMGIEYNYVGSKFNLFKSGASSPYHSINEKKENIHFNNFHNYNKLHMNQTTNFNEYKKFMISNSIENNIHMKSLSPKAISSNISINNNRKNKNIGLNKIAFNKINNNLKNQNINSKIKIPIRHNKNSISYSNSNYNINFNNLIFYGPNTPTSFIDDIKYNLINNNNNSNNNNQNLNKINTNFYMMNFNNIYNNSRNKIKFNTNNSSSQNKLKTHTNSQSKNMKKNENEKHSTNNKKNRLRINEKKIPFIVNRKFIGNVRKNLRNTLAKEKNNKLLFGCLNLNLKNNNSIKKKNNKSFNISDSEKNNENGIDRIEKRKFSLINLKRMPNN